MTTPEQLEKEAAEFEDWFRHAHDHAATTLWLDSAERIKNTLDQAIAGWKTQWELAEHWSKAAHRNAEQLDKANERIAQLVAENHTYLDGSALREANARIAELEKLINNEAGLSDYHASRATLMQYEKWLAITEAERDSKEAGRQEAEAAGSTAIAELRRMEKEVAAADSVRGSLVRVNDSALARIAELEAELADQTLRADENYEVVLERGRTIQDLKTDVRRTLMPKPRTT